MRLRQLGDRPLPLREMVMMQIHDAKHLPPKPGMGLGEDQTPGWARGLRQLYREVAEEPIPSDFAELLARLDGKPAPAPARRGKPRWMI